MFKKGTAACKQAASPAKQIEVNLLSTADRKGLKGSCEAVQAFTLPTHYIYAALHYLAGQASTPGACRWTHRCGLHLVRLA